MAEIKYKAWDGEKMYQSFNLLEGLNEKYAWWAGKYPENTVFLQYIGIRNNDGDEIYEGDILFDSHKGNKYKVFRVAGGFAINTHQDDLNKEKVIFYSGLSDMQNASWVVSCKVIGNIYVNPELLT